ncbi:MAG: SPOR domain-containing protein [Rhodospirillales bacterium]|nr:SPOR domain-containing protein [Alphaproteobacteria bacterium]USO04487.1 MAG: SPOR domain-containing protein [Rhodospirillales bacterium]
MDYRDEFDYGEEGGVTRRFSSLIGPRVAVASVIIALLVLAGVFWQGYPGGGAGEGSAVPIIRADAEGFKVEPADPGGMQVSHRDSTVFGAMDGQDEEIENLLDEEGDEEALPRSQLFAGLNTDDIPPQPRAVVNEEGGLAEDKAEDKMAGASSVQEKEPQDIPDLLEPHEMMDTALDDIQGKTPAAEEKTTQTAPKIAVVAPSPASKPARNVETEESVSSAPSPSQIEPAAGGPAAGSFYVQLGSVKSSDGAESEWKKIRAKYSSELSGYSHRVQRADLGDKGVFYRIQAGPVSKESASSTCRSIQQVTPGGCLVVGQ